MNCGNYPLHSSYLGNTREPQQSITGATAGIAICATVHAWLTHCSDILGTAAKEASACLSKRSFRGQHPLALQARSDERETCVYLNFRALPSPHPISPSLCRHCCDFNSSSVLLNISAEAGNFYSCGKLLIPCESVTPITSTTSALDWLAQLLPKDSSWWAKKGSGVISRQKSSGLHTHTYKHIKFKGYLILKVCCYIINFLFKSHHIQIWWCSN